VEKRKPHYDLGTIQATFCEENALRITATGMAFARTIGMTRADIVTCIQGMTRSQFYKSMTSTVDHRIWQDVYHVPRSTIVLYVKFTTDSEGYLLISFKER
jgi:motility quorum-sensing regulator/GCU-specific mRNA interferase toxin